MADEDKSTDRSNESNEDVVDDIDADSSSPDSSTDEASDLFDDAESSSSSTDEEPSSLTDEEPSSDALTDVGSSSSTDEELPSSTDEESSSGSTIDVEVTRPDSASGESSTSSDSTSDVMDAASPAEAAALERVRMVSQLLDEAFEIPGTNYRVGLDPILGALPVAGDAIPTALSFYPIVEAYRLDVPNKTLMKMLALVAVDATVGSIPVVGTAFDAVWKANKWNVEMLERHIQQS